jgi:RND superfamily putative drug exporter
MFTFLGNIVARAWWLILALWIGLLAGSHLLAPNWNGVAEDKEFAFLPPNVPSRVAEGVFRQAFPEDQTGSNIVIVLTDPRGNLDRNKKFIEDVLEPDLRQLAAAEGGLAGQDNGGDDLFSNEPSAAKPSKTSIIDRIRTPNAPGAGALLQSEDGQALLVVMDLTTEFFSSENWPTIERTEELLASLKKEGKLPEGVAVGLTGSAVLGRDLTQARLQGARSTEFYTVVLVVAFLILIYRAPLLALIPLLTVYMSVHTALNLLSLLAERHAVVVFQGLQVYITVLTYGAGVDYCLFLMARYKEELDRGANTSEAVERSIGSVGAALVASAGTVMCGIGMMYFAQFGKFRQAGIAIPFSLLIALCMTLTFSAAIMRMVGRWAFWPFHAPAGKSAEPRAQTGPWRRFFQTGELSRGWEWVGGHIIRRPGAIWLASVAVLVPFAVAGGAFANKVDYDMLGNLPSQTTSVVGARMLEQHFPSGVMGIVSVLVVNPRADFYSESGRKVVADVTQRLQDEQQNLGLADIRSLSKPLGITSAAERGLATIDLPQDLRARSVQEQARERYTTDMGERRRVGTRLDLVLTASPFADTSVAKLDQLEQVVRAALPEQFRDTTNIYIQGATASVRDLSAVIKQDHSRIFVLVLSVVFLILMVLLRRPVVSFYMVLSVLFSYYVTMGVTCLVFWALEGNSFGGLDWKVSTFLFTILIAVGEDYNIFLMARVHEEQHRYGRLRGILRALTQTGPVISSCGIIMAGTFGSLMSGSLLEMKELGFALAFGVLLDTFVVRPILVPTFLILLENYRIRHRFPLLRAAGKLPWAAAGSGEQTTTRRP